MISIIIPVYDEWDILYKCLSSLLNQSFKDFEIIVVDDGSPENFELRTKNEELFKYKKITYMRQKHLGPGAARNLGSKKAKGNILVFIDADMTFDKHFLEFLIKPILAKKAIGTFSKEEYLLNKNNIWALCWNINRYVINGWNLDQQIYTRMLPCGYPDQQEVYRAILKSAFAEIGGFNRDGYTDDWSLYNKLKIKAVNSPGAIYFHNNPADLNEVFTQASWIGKNKFLTGSLLRKLFYLAKYFFVVSFFSALWTAIKTGIILYIPFKLIYDAAVFKSIIQSFFIRDKYK